MLRFELTGGGMEKTLEGEEQQVQRPWSKREHGM